MFQVVFRQAVAVSPKCQFLRDVEDDHRSSVKVSCSIRLDSRAAGQEVAFLDQEALQAGKITVKAVHVVIMFVDLSRSL